MGGPFWTNKNAAPIQSHHFMVSFGDLERYTVKSVTLPSLEISSNEYQVGNQVFKYPGVGKWNDITLTLVDTKETLEQVVKELGYQDFSWGRGARIQDFGVKKTQTGGFVAGIETDKVFRIYQQKTYARSIQRTEAERSSGFMNAIESGLDFLGVTQPGSNQPTAVGTKKFNPPLSQDAVQVSNVFELYNPWIKTVNFGNHDYSSDELITIELVVTYDYAEITTGQPETVTGFPFQ